MEKIKQRYKFKSCLKELDSSVWGKGFFLPHNISEPLKTNKIKRVWCKIFDFEAFQTGIISAGENGYFIKLNKEQIKNFKLHSSEKFSIQVWKDESKYGLPIAEEFQILLEQDDEFRHHFHKLSAGKQRSLLYIVNKPKNPDLRLQKAIIISEHLKESVGKLDFKALNEALRS